VTYGALAFSSRSTVRAYSCERLDQEAFTGDVVAQIKERIEKASLVIADLTGHNPNVFLEVGYAWGRGRPTVLLLRRSNNPKKPDILPFGVSTQRCIFHEDATDLEEQLLRELRLLLQ
jgi:nucleoside 2-deoxyribosyltransferase